MRNADGEEEEREIQNSRTRTHWIQVNTGWKLREEAKTFRGKKCFGFMVDQKFILRLQSREQNLMCHGG